MGTVNRIVQNDKDKEMLVKLILSKTEPFTVTMTDGKHRTTPQNRLQRLWMIEISEQLGDRTPEEVRGECKLTLGVPILRDENDAFRAAYDEHVKPLSYEQKMAFMMMPLDFPVTRLMTTAQGKKYLDAIHRHYSGNGIVLTNPDDRGRYGSDRPAQARESA